MAWTNKQVANLLLRRQQLIEELLAEFDLRSVQVAVEMATGDGSGAIALRTMLPTATIIAVDWDLDFLYRRLVAAKDTRIELVCSDVTGVGLRDKSADFILLHNVLRHLGGENAKGCLRETARVLEQGGRCLIAERVKHPKNLDQAHMQVLHDLEYDIAVARGEKPEDVLFDDEVDAMITAAGMEIMQAETLERRTASVSAETWASIREDLQEDIGRLDEETAVPFQSRLETLDSLVRNSGMQMLPLRVVLGEVC